MDQHNSVPNTTDIPVSTSAPASTSPSNSSLPKIEGPVSMFKFSWNLFKNNWNVIVPIAVVPSVVGYIGTLSSLAPHNVFFVILSIVAFVIGGVLSVVLVPTLINTIQKLSTQPETIILLKDQYRFGFSYFWSIIFAGIIAAMVGLGATALLIIPGIIIGVYVSLYSYALVIDGKKGFASLIESYNLVRGRWLAVVGRSLFLGLVMLVIWVIIGLLMSIIGLGGKDAPKEVVGLINILGSAVLTPLAVGYSYRMYMSLKSLRQPEISTKKFKNWLVGFVVIGSVALIFMVITVPLVVIGSLKSAQINSNTARVNLEQKMAEVQKAIQESQAASATSK